MNLIFGASGHATEIEWLTNVCTPPAGDNFRADCFVVQDATPQVLHVGLPVITETQAEQLAGHHKCFIGVGQPHLRQKIWHKFHNPMFSWPRLIHQSVIFDSKQGQIEMGQGSILFPGCILTSQINIGRHVHINVGSSISHDVRIGDFCTLSPGVRLAGKVCLGERVFLGMGALVAENIRICADVVIGAGAVVLCDIIESGTYVGVPAKKIK